MTWVNSCSPASLTFKPNAQGCDHVAVAGWLGSQFGCRGGSLRAPPPGTTLLYQLVQEYCPALKVYLTDQGSELPGYVEQEFEDYLKCGRLEHGFMRVCCDSCHAEHLVAFSCKRRGLLRASCPPPFRASLRLFKIAPGDFVCPSCGARRMAESAALLVDDILPVAPVRQWVLSFPYALRFLFATHLAVMGRVLGIVYRTLATHQIRKAGHNHRTARTGTVTLIQHLQPLQKFRECRLWPILDLASLGADMNPVDIQCLVTAHKPGTSRLVQNKFPLTGGKPELGHSGK
jgi:hypothetical protein